MDDVVVTVLVLLSQMIEYADFDQSLMVESLLISDYLDGDVLIGHVI